MSIYTKEGWQKDLLPDAFPSFPDPAKLLLPLLFPFPEGLPETEFVFPGSRGRITSSIIFPTYVPGVSDFLTFLPILRPLFPERISFPLPNSF